MDNEAESSELSSGIENNPERFASQIKDPTEFSAAPDQETSLLQDDAEPVHSLPDVESKRKLIQELDALIERLKALQPDYSPPPFSPQGLIHLVGSNLGKLSPGAGFAVLERLRTTISEDWLDVDTWKGVWYLLNYSLEYQQDFLTRRFSGDYETDEWGLDWEIVQMVEPFLSFMYKTYWRVETTGMEYIPAEGRTLLVSNHSGQLPWDGAMIGTAIYTEHPAQRIVRALYATWFSTLPFVSSTLTKMGQVLADEENAVRLLEQEQLVAVFPEGIKGVGKLYKERYRLARFGRGGFVRMALKTGAPMIPVSVVGAEETYISLAKVPLIAKMISFPYFPITPTWPWLGLLGFVPFPTKWYIDFGEPIPTDIYGRDAANNLVLVSQLADQVRNVIQGMIFARLEKRKSVLFG